MTIGLPQLIMISVTLLTSAVAVVKYGQPKRPDDVYDSVDVFWSPVLLNLLLYWGGFYGR